MKQILPPLPPRLESATRAAAETLTAIAHAEGLELGSPDGAARPHLHTILYLLRDRCVQAEREPQPALGDQLITATEIAAALETIAQQMISDQTYDLAGYNPSWFIDAALVVERLGQEAKSCPPSNWGEL